MVEQGSTIPQEMAGMAAAEATAALSETAATAELVVAERLAGMENL
jgi:hypothetical protein